MLSLSLKVATVAVVSFTVVNSILAEQNKDLKIKIENGWIQGRWQRSRGGTQFSSFEGIPFAKPPRRFQPPQPAGKWDGVWNATYTRSACPQIEPINQEHLVDENCLFLNVYVPQITHVRPLPTMVWIHGGGFRDGSGGFTGPHYFMDEEIILVTINYRLGAFGFLSTGDSLVSGNMGLKDQILALRWTQRNIKFFGGDPKNVTIFGESAGGASVHHLMLSPAAKGLFQKVVSQSGSALNHWSYIPHPKDSLLQLAKYAKCYTDKGMGEIVNCLQNLSAKKLLQAQSQIVSHMLPFAPVIDSDASDFSVIPDTPRKLITDYSDVNSVNVPLLIGHNQEEGLVFAYALTSDPAALTAINLFWNTRIPNILGYDQFFIGREEEMNRVSHALRQFYLKGRFVDTTTMASFVHMFSDVFMAFGIRHSAVAHSKTNRNVFTYNLRYRGNFSIGEFVVPPGSPKFPPTHADDLQYLFNSLLTPVPNWPNLIPGSKDELMSKNIVKLWASFATTGFPKSLHQESDDWNPLPALDIEDNVSWYILDYPGREEAEDGEFYHRMQFVNKLFRDSGFEASACKR